MIKIAAMEYFKEWPDVMRVQDVAKALHCSKNTIYDFIDRGVLEVLKVGRVYKIPKVNLVDFITNEKLYHIVSPNVPKNLLQNAWTSGKSCGMVGVADRRTTQNTTRKGASK